MNFLAFSGLLNFLTSISLGFLVFSRNPSRQLNQTYFAFNFFIAIYSIGYFFWQTSQNIGSASTWFHLLFTGIILINSALLFFVFSLTEQITKKKAILALHTLVSVVFLIFHSQNLIYQGLEQRLNLGFWPIPTNYFNAYLIYWHWSCFYGFYQLLVSWYKSEGLRRQQIKLVTIACSIGYLGGATNWPMWYKLYFIPYPNITISIYVGLIAYAISRHRLMDFNLLLRWALACSILLIILTAIVLPLVLITERISQYHLHLTPGFSIIIVLCILVFLFDPLRKSIYKFIDLIIFKSPDFQSLLSGIESALKSDFDLVNLSRFLGENLKSIFGAKHAGFAIWDFRLAQFSLFPPEEFNEQIITKIHEVIGQTDFLVKTLESERRLFWQGIVLEDELTALGNLSSPGERTTFWKIRRTMRWLGGGSVDTVNG